MPWAKEADLVLSRHFAIERPEFVQQLLCTMNYLHDLFRFLNAKGKKYPAAN
jgi:hypothetical protein